MSVLNLFIGPPSSPAFDSVAVSNFLNRPGYKVICGGTSYRIFNREAGIKAEPDLSTYSDGVPPFSIVNDHIAVTECSVTLEKFIITFKSAYDVRNAVRFLKQKISGASEIHIFHSRNSFPLKNKKQQIIQNFLETLKSAGINPEITSL